MHLKINLIKNKFYSKRLSCFFYCLSLASVIYGCSTYKNKSCFHEKEHTKDFFTYDDQAFDEFFNTNFDTCFLDDEIFHASEDKIFHLSN